MELPLSDSIITAISKLVDDAQVDSREPSHSDLEFQIEQAGLTQADPKTHGRTVGKAKRVRSTLNWALENDIKAGSKLVHLILSQIKALGGFRDTSQNYVGHESIRNLISVFDSENFSLSENGDIHPKVLATLKGKHLTKALEKYAERAKRGSEDAALLSGTGKDLLEATAKHIIQSKYGTSPKNANFPALLGQAYAALQMATPQTPKAGAEPAIKDYERALFEVAVAVSTIRNKEGTGHGRPNVTALSVDDSSSLIETVGIVAGFLLNRLNKSN